MASWDKLPAELRLQVLENVAGRPPCAAAFNIRMRVKRTEHNWAHYATVSREWQVFFERRTFADIYLSNDHVQHFCNAIEHRVDRLTYIMRLRLTIDLPEYSHSESDAEEDAATVERNNITFTRYLWPLMRTLALWKGPEMGQGPINMRSDAMFYYGKFNTFVGIQLELGVRSISDTENRLRNYRLVHPHCGVLPTDRMEYVNVNTNDYLKHAFTGRGIHRRALPVPPGAIRRILGARFLELNAGGLSDQAGGYGVETEREGRYQKHHGLLPAAIVTKLVLSRRFYRGVHPATLSHLLRVCFTQVRFLHLEPWQPIDEDNLRILERGYIAFLANLPPSVEHLSIFLESNHVLHGSNNGGFRTDGALTHCRPNPRLGRQLALSCGNCHLVNVVFLIEAEDFFAEVLRVPGKMWPRLTTLILSSSVLTPQTSPDEIQRLLLLAAATAGRMPNLKVFELCFARGPHAFVLTVSRKKILFKSTWDLTQVVTAEIVQAWEAALPLGSEPLLEVSLVSTELKWMDGRWVLTCDTSYLRRAMLYQSRREMFMERLSFSSSLE